MCRSLGNSLEEREALGNGLLHSATHVVGKAPTTGVSVAAPPEAVGGPMRGRLALP